MSNHQQVTGRERRDQPRQEGQRLRWVRENPLLVGAGVVTGVLVGLALILAVFGGGGDGEPSTDALPNPTEPATVAVEDSGPPPVSAEPIFTDTGLGIIDIEAGTGEMPVPGQILVVHYTGWLSENGTKFESSLDRGTPIEFALGAGRVIAGWDEGLATMKVGGKRRLIIPADLAYGERGRPPTIPANAELTFDIELLEIKEDSGPPPVSAEPIFTDTGLGIIDIEAGTGETPVPGQILVVHYTGWLSENGTKFDSSLDRGTPFEFAFDAGQVIAGWDEGVATMKVGGKRRLIIPADLAYGEQGRPPTIPPNAELTFDIELLEIKEAP